MNQNSCVRKRIAESGVIISCVLNVNFFRNLISFYSKNFYGSKNPGKIGLLSGDRNTKFYHASTLVRRSRNRIALLQNSQGEWISGPMVLEDMVQKFYVLIP